MNQQDLDRIRASDTWRIHRTEIVTCADGSMVVVKGQRPARGALANHVLGFAASMSGLPLQNSPVLGGRAGQDVEVRRLRELHAAGVRVPRVLHEDAEFFVMEMLPGPNLAQALAGDAGSLLLWEEGMHFIQRVHVLGQYLSQGYARNFIVAPRGLGAIDFEDDPLQVMTLEEAQARDWLMYLHSTVWMMLPERRQLLQFWGRVAEGETARVVEVLERMARGMGWMRHLPRKRKPWGRDVISTQGAADFIHDWERGRASR